MPKSIALRLWSRAQSEMVRLGYGRDSPDTLSGDPSFGLPFIEVTQRKAPIGSASSMCLFGLLSALLHCRRPIATQEYPQSVNINGKGKFALPRTTPAASTPPVVAATENPLTSRLGRVHTDQRRAPRRSGHHRHGCVWAALGTRRG